MRGQVWAEILVVVSGLFLGALLMIPHVFEHVPSEASPFLPAVALAKAKVDHSTLLPHEIVHLSVEGGEVNISVFPDDGRIEEELNNLGVQVR